MSPEIRDDRQMRALTGIPTKQLAILQGAFATALADEKERVYQAALVQGQRRRKPGGGQKGKMPSVYEKLIFVLYYLKVYPTFDVLGSQFGLSRSKACEKVHELLPILGKALADLEVLPHRDFKTVEEFRAACNGLEHLLIDVTERPHRRPADDDAQQDLYSGKKTTHAEKHDYGDHR